MSFFDLQESGSQGLKPRTVDFFGHLVSTGEAENAFTKGMVGVLDRTRTSTDTTSSRPGVAGSRWVNLITPITALLGTGTFGCALEDVSKGADGLFRLQGRCQAFCLNSGSTVTAGALCAAVHSEEYLESGTPAAGAKLIFELDESSDAADDGTTLHWGWFSGD